MRSFKFEYEDQYSLTLNIHDNEHFTGQFTIDNRIQTPFSGIGLKLKENSYSLSFIVNWKHLKRSNQRHYTAFNGEISRDCSDLFCLSLNWLLISECCSGEGSVKKSNGQSKLYETIFEHVNNQNGRELPFPNQKIQSAT